MAVKTKSEEGRKESKKKHYIVFLYGRKINTDVYSRYVIKKDMSKSCSKSTRSIQGRDASSMDFMHLDYLHPPN